ncbi:MAG: hypothetical protein IPG75_20800 [Gemmatimonadetes bacterium]|nr:hypothetical protein [Gemmatimonadota bacterium]
MSRILQDLPGEHFASYRSRLNDVSAGLTPDQASRRLLHNLGSVLKETAEQSGGDTSEDDKYLCEELPNLLGDVVLGRYFLKQGGVLDTIAQRITGNGTVDLLAQRREFVRGDLPRNVRDYDAASAPARDIYQALFNESLADDAIRVLNRHLDRAIADLMKLGGRTYSN